MIPARLEGNLGGVLSIVSEILTLNGCSQFVPLLSNVSLENGSIQFKKRLGPIAALVVADVTVVGNDDKMTAEAGCLELDIQKINASGVPMAWALRGKIGDTIVSELKPFSQFVRCWKAWNGNLRFRIPGLTFTGVTLIESKIVISLSV